MANNLIGVVVHSDYVDVVVLQQDDPTTFTLQDETTLQLQTGDRALAYQILHDQFRDYVSGRHATHVCIKQSALSRGGMTMAHLEAAELRGVVKCAAVSGGAEVCLFNKASVSRVSGNAGGRNVDGYLKDDTHWSNIGLTNVSKGRREAAFAVVTTFAQ